jgi:hypothetical protein
MLTADPRLDQALRGIQCAELASLEIWPDANQKMPTTANVIVPLPEAGLNTYRKPPTHPIGQNDRSPHDDGTRSR